MRMVSYLNLSRDGTRLAAGGYGSAGVGDYFVTVIWDLKIPDRLAMHLMLTRLRLVRTISQPHRSVRTARESFSGTRAHGSVSRCPYRVNQKLLMRSHLVLTAKLLRLHSGCKRARISCYSGTWFRTGSGSWRLVVINNMCTRWHSLPMAHDWHPWVTRLASVHGDGTVMSWDFSVESWMDRACAIANRNLTPFEWQQYLANSPYRMTCAEAAGRMPNSSSSHQ